MRTEREAGRYEPLNETHRRVAEEEEKRRLAAEQEQTPVAKQQREDEHDPASPEARLAAKQKVLDEKVRLKLITPGEMIHAMRQEDNEIVVEMNIKEMRRVRDQQAPARQPDQENSADRPPERLREESEAAREQPIEPARADASQPVPETRIERDAEAAAYEITGRGEMTDARAARLARLRQFEQDIERESRQHEVAEPRQQAENVTDRTDDRGRDDANRRVPEKQIEREAEAVEYEVTGRGEMTDARAARLARLRGIDQDIERETRDGEGKGVDRSNDLGDRSR